MRGERGCGVEEEIWQGQKVRRDGREEGKKHGSKGESAWNEGEPGEVGVRHRPRRRGRDGDNWSAGEEKVL